MALFSGTTVAPVNMSVLEETGFTEVTVQEIADSTLSPAPSLGDAMSSDSLHTSVDTTATPSTATSCLSPSSLAVSPSSLAVSPSSLAVSPSSLAVSPSSLAVSPSSLAVSPSSLAVSPSSLAVSPSSLAVSPSSLAVSPPSLAVSPSSVVIQSPSLAVSPSSLAVSPSSPDFSPSSLAVSPSSLAVSPSSPDPGQFNVSTAASSWSSAEVSSTAVLPGTTVESSASPPVSLETALKSSWSDRTESPSLDDLYNATGVHTTLAPYSNWTESLTWNATSPAPYSVAQAGWTPGVSVEAEAGLGNASLPAWAAELASASLANLTRSVSQPATTATSVLAGRAPSLFPSPASSSSSDVDPVTVLKTVVLTLIALVAVTSHGVIIWSVVRQRFLHRPPFYYLLSFCVTELSRALFCLPLVLVSVLQRSVWRYGASACKLFAFANCFFVYSAALALLAVAIDRHFSIVYVKVYRRRSRGLVNLAVVLVSWTVAFAVSFPPVLGAGSYVFIPAENQCTFHHRFYRANDTLGFMLVFALVVAAALFLYFRIFAFLRGHRKMRPLDHPPARSNNWTFFGPGANGQAMINWFNGFGGVQNPYPGGPHPLRQARPPFGRLVNLQAVRNEHLTRLFFVVTLVFGAFWLPYVVTSFWRVFGDGDRLEQAFVTSAAWLTYAQVAACPVAYLIARRPQRRLSRTVYQEQDQKEFLLEPRHPK